MLGEQLKVVIFTMGACRRQVQRRRFQTGTAGDLATCEFGRLFGLGCIIYTFSRPFYGLFSLFGRALLVLSFISRRLSSDDSSFLNYYLVRLNSS